MRFTATMGPADSQPTGQPADLGEDLAHVVLGPIVVEIFENLYSAYAEDARRVAYSVLRDRELAADAAHIGFVELLRYILSGKRWFDSAEARAAGLRRSKWTALKMTLGRLPRPEVGIPVAPAPGS